MVEDFGPALRAQLVTWQKLVFIVIKAVAPKTIGSLPAVIHHTMHTRELSSGRKSSSRLRNQTFKRFCRFGHRTRPAGQNIWLTKAPCLLSICSVQPHQRVIAGHASTVDLSWWVTAVHQRQQASGSG